MKDLNLEEDSEKDDDDCNDLDAHAVTEPASDSNTTIDAFISKDPESIEREGNSLILVGDSSEGVVPATGDAAAAAAETAAGEEEEEEEEEEDAAAEPAVVDNNTDSEERNLKIQQAKVVKIYAYIALLSYQLY